MRHEFEKIMKMGEFLHRTLPPSTYKEVKGKQKIMNTGRTTKFRLMFITTLDDLTIAYPYKNKRALRRQYGRAIRKERREKENAKVS